MPVDIDQLHGLLRATLENLREMHGLLEQEAEALGTRDAEAMDRIAVKKQELVPVLDRLAAEQRLCLGDSEDEAGIEACLARAGVHASVADLLRADWREILRLLTACKRRNELNGAYIGLLSRHVETSLDILLGPSQAEATYGRDGVKRRGGVSRRSYSV